MKTLMCIVGETASGKDSLVNKLINNYPDKFKAVCSYATRPKRDNEIPGKDHYFVNKEFFDMLKKNLEESNSLVAYTKIASKDNPDGFEYLASLEEVQNSNIYIIDPNGIKSLKENFPEIAKNMVVIYITASLSNRVKRARKNRSDFKTEFKKRVMNEYEQFLDFNIEKEYDFIIHNEEGDFEKSYELLENKALFFCTREEIK